MLWRPQNLKVTSALSLSFLTPLLVASLILAAECYANGRAKNTPIGRSGQSESISSEADLADLIVKLDRPQTRMQALAVLISFSAGKLYQMGSLSVLSGDRRLDEMQERAAAAVRSCVDIETVGKALDSDNGKLQFWGVWFWKTGFQQRPDSETAAWLSLMPTVERLAAEGEEIVRAVAVERLQQCPGTEVFLAERARVETSSDVLLKLLRPPDEKGYSGRVNKALLRLLDSGDEEIRLDALACIGSNSYRAPVWQVTFSRAIFDSVLEKTRSDSGEERAAAAYALTDVRGIDRARSRKEFIRLSGDASADVRWRAAFGLLDQLDREGVRRVMDTLLTDESSLVRYMTIIALGPEKYIAELRRLAQDSDPKVVSGAAGVLKRLEQDGRLK